MQMDGNLVVECCRPGESLVLRWVLHNLVGYRMYSISMYCFNDWSTASLSTEAFFVIATQPGAIHFCLFCVFVFVVLGFCAVILCASVMMRVLLAALLNAMGFHRILLIYLLGNNFDLCR